MDASFFQLKRGVSSRKRKPHGASIFKFTMSQQFTRYERQSCGCTFFYLIDVLLSINFCTFHGYAVLEGDTALSVQDA